MQTPAARRPLKVRQKSWPGRLAFALVKRGLRPNQISLCSAGVSFVGAAFLLLGPRWPTIGQAIAFIVAVICIQLRLLCNLLDGLMAVEGGLKTKAGEVFNEFPDRLADVSLLVAAGYSIQPYCAGAIELGYWCAIAALITAYVRVFGGSMGLAEDYSGPMAKQQRMAVLTFACFLSAIEALLLHDRYTMDVALFAIFLGSLFTAGRRTVRIVRLLNAR